MSSRRSRALALTLGWLVASGATVLGVRAAPVENSDLDASSFYEIITGEIALRDGDLGAGYQQLLNAAKRSRDETLFRRAVEVALSAGSREQALGAAKAWRTAAPRSASANEFLGRLLMASHRDAEALPALREWLAATPAAERAQAILSLPRVFAPSTDPRTALEAQNELTRPYVNDNDASLRAAAWVVRAQAASVADDDEAALRAARLAQAADPASQGAALVAIEQLGRPEAQALIERHLEVKPDSPVRLVYVRRLIDTNQAAAASAQLESYLSSKPRMAGAWLALGALQFDMKNPKGAEASLKRYLQLQGEEPRASEGDSDEDPAAALGAQNRTQAYLLLAQIAEQRGDLAAAEQWWSRIDDPKQALAVQTARARSLVRQGKIDAARELIRKTPQREPEDARAKALAEAQLLRDAGRWQDAYGVLDAALATRAEDVDLIYEKAMVAERLGRSDEMEKLLREVMRLKPEYHHAYNALGYSLADRNERLDEARSLVAKALSMAPGDPFITDSMGWVEYRAGRNAEAIRLLRKAWTARPDTEIGAHLGEVLWVNGQRDEARRIWRQARQKDAENQVLQETLTRLRVNL